MTSPLLSPLAPTIALSKASSVEASPTSSLSQRTVKLAIPFFRGRVADANKTAQIKNLAVKNIQDELKGLETKLHELEEKVKDCQARLELSTQEQEKVCKELITNQSDLQILLEPIRNVE